MKFRRRLMLESLENRIVLSGGVCVAADHGKGEQVEVGKGSSSDNLVKPFKIDGGGNVDFLPLDPTGDPARHDAVGNATFLGKYEAVGMVKVDAFTGPLTADFSSAEPVVFIAANGDELHFDYAGTVELTPLAGGQFDSEWTAEFTPVIGSSTGRFASVVGGSFTMIANAGPMLLTDTDIPYTWHGKGELEFAKAVPYKASGTGAYAPLTGDYSGPGKGTHIGKHTYSGNVATVPTANPLVFDFANTAPQVTVAANGDELHFLLSGQVTLIPVGGGLFEAEWSGDAVVVGGTGRFSNAKSAVEPMKVTAVNDPFSFADASWTYSWNLEGDIVLQ